MPSTPRIYCKNLISGRILDRFNSSRAHWIDICRNERFNLKYGVGKTNRRERAFGTVEVSGFHQDFAEGRGSFSVDLTIVARSIFVFLSLSSACSQAIPFIVLRSRAAIVRAKFHDTSRKRVSIQSTSEDREQQLSVNESVE